MDRNLKLLWIVFVAGTLIPLLIILPLSFLGWFESNSGPVAFFALLSLAPLALYYYYSHQIMNKGHKSDDSIKTILSLTYYVNFLIYMIAVLISFNLIIMGFFLINGDVPMGMNLVPSQVPLLIGGGIYILSISICGMIYLSQTKSKMRGKM